MNSSSTSRSYDCQLTYFIYCGHSPSIIGSVTNTIVIPLPDLTTITTGIWGPADKVWLADVQLCDDLITIVSVYCLIAFRASFRHICRKRGWRDDRSRCRCWRWCRAWARGRSRVSLCARRHAVCITRYLEMVRSGWHRCLFYIPSSSSRFQRLNSIPGTVRT